MLTKRLVLILALVCIVMGTAYSSVPPTISYQGRLTQPSGAPVADGTYSMLFCIYDVPTGGTPLWSETNPAVQVKGGLFATMLGSVVNIPANIFDDATRYFAVKVGSDPEMTPRQPVGSSAFAFRAATIDDGAITASKLAAGAVDNTALASGSITLDKLAAGLGTPAGAVMQYAGSSAPTGWLLCDGSAVSRTGDNADLFAAIGTTYGAGNGSTTFNLPDMRGRVAMGTGQGVGDNSSGTGKPSGTSLATRSRGDWGGQQTHTLTIAEMPAHTHSSTEIFHDYNGGGSSHSYLASGTSNLVSNPFLNSSTGGGGAHNVIQPYVVVNYIIKY